LVIFSSVYILIKIWYNIENIYKKGNVEDVVINKIKKKIDGYHSKAQQYTYLSKLKLDLLRIVIITQMVVSLLVIIYSIFANLSKYAVYSQIGMIVAMIIFAVLIKIKIDLNIVSVIVALFYTIIISPGIWMMLGAYHPLPLLFLLFSAILIILLLEGLIRSIILIPYFVIGTIIYISDIIFVSKDIGVLGSINRSVSLLLACALISLAVWMFKAKLLMLSKELYDNSIRDGLTGAYNGRMMSETIAKYTTEYTGENSNFSLVMVDMDNFKLINDVYGHDVGDSVLREFVQHVRKYIRDKDLLARYGGDEFVLLFPECNKAKTTEIMTRILGETHSLKSRYSDINLSFSAGVCDCIDATSQNLDIIKLADQRMYTAKRNGKDSIIAAD